jgi:hypothetical protein
MAKDPLSALIGIVFLSAITGIAVGGFCLWVLHTPGFAFGAIAVAATMVIQRVARDKLLGL